MITFWILLNISHANGVFISFKTYAEFVKTLELKLLYFSWLLGSE